MNNSKNYGNVFLDIDLPKPITDIELRGLIQRYQNGEKELLDMIILYNVRMVINVARGFNFCVDDLVSVGLERLIKVIDSFDLTMNVKFSTYLYQCLKNNMIVYVSKEDKYRLRSEEVVSKLVNLYEFGSSEIQLEDGSTYSYLDIIGCEDSYIDVSNKETLRELRELVMELPQRQKDVITHYYGFNGERYTMQEIASKFLVSTNYVCLINKDVIDLFRVKLEEKGLITRAPSLKVRRRVEREKRRSS